MRVQRFLGFTEDQRFKHVIRRLVALVLHHQRTGTIEERHTRPPPRIPRLSTITSGFGFGQRTDLACLLLVICFWIAAVIAVNPIGDFPLNDDWAYGGAVRTLIQEGDFRLSGWTATNLLGQVLWGALFCLPLGFSFTALRVSTLVLRCWVFSPHMVFSERRGPRFAWLCSALS